MAERKAPARKAAPSKKAAAPEPEPTAPAAEAEPDPAGFVGDHTDPTPNEHYTLRGVIKGLPIPEHDKPVG